MAIAHRRLPRHELTTENSEWMRRFEADTDSDCYTRKFRDADTLGSSDNLNLPSCPSQMVVTPNAGDGTYSLWHSPDAMDGNGSADSLVVTFSRPVGMLTILREGTHSCYDATIGQVVAYGANGAELGRSPFNLIQTCSDAMPILREAQAADIRVGAPAASAAPYTSPYAEYAEAVLPIPAGVTRLVFLPPAVWDFTFVNPYFPDDIRQYKRQGTYSLIYRTESPLTDSLLVDCPVTVVRGVSVTCRVRTALGETPFIVDSVLSVAYPLRVDSISNGVPYPPGLPPVSVLDSAVQIAAGDSYSFGGVVVLDTRISVYGRLLFPGAAASDFALGIALPRAGPTIQSGRRTPTATRSP